MTTPSLPPATAAALTPVARSLWDWMAFVACHSNGGEVPTIQGMSRVMKLTPDNVRYAADELARAGLAMRHGDMIVPTMQTGGAR